MPNLETLTTQTDQTQIQWLDQRQTSKSGTSPRLQVPALFVCDARDGTHDSHPLNEHGNAQRLLDLHGTRVRYVIGTRSWLIWEAGTWVWDADGAKLRSLAFGLGSRIYDEGRGHLADARHFARWARESQKLKVADQTVKILSDQEPVRLARALIDANEFLVGFDQGRQVVDLLNGEVRMTAECDYITKSMNVRLLGDKTKATNWLRFLEQVFDNDKSLIDWIHRFCGYALTASTREQIFLFCYGSGSNGKSVFIELLQHMLGDYACVIAPATLTDSKRRAGSPTPDLAALIGTRLAVSSETEEDTGLAESLVKSLVGGDSMPVRELNARQGQFTPAFKLVMAGNHKPVVRGNDNGIWRRIRLVPFNRTFTPKEKDPFLLDKLKGEAPHILAWMIDGCVRWKKQGLADTPRVIEQATNEYRSDQDIVDRWLGECTARKSDSEETTKDLYTSYRTWCVANEVRPVSSQVFGRRLGEKGFTSRKSNSNHLWRGLALLPPAL
jgi:P4 family phage/plasmid primase-like protien